jgi:hypothetical protein
MFKIYEDKKTLNYLFSRYGINKDYFNNFLFICNNNKLFIITKDKQEIIQEILKKKDVVNIGVELFCDIKKMIPCSLGFCVIDANVVKQNYVVFNRQLVVDYLAGKKISINDVVKKNILSKGYVICLYNNNVVGTCYYEENLLTPNIAFENKRAK